MKLNHFEKILLKGALKSDRASIKILRRIGIGLFLVTGIVLITLSLIKNNESVFSDGIIVLAGLLSLTLVSTTQGLIKKIIQVDKEELAKILTSLHSSGNSGGIPV